MKFLEKIIDQLECPKCHNYLMENQGNLECELCKSSFCIKDDYIEFIVNNNNNKVEQDSLIYRLKCFFKKYPSLFYVMAFVFGAPPINKSVNKFIASIKNDNNLILNIGSGSKQINEKVVNVDCLPFKGVSVVANAENLPFKNNSIDIIICDYVLEHVKNPQVIVDEIYRILKPNGLVYIGLPFIISYHSAPSDYFRWTKNGVQELLKKFYEIELNPAYGPTSAMTNVLGEWLSILLSFNIKFLYQIFNIIFMIVFSPIKHFDFLLSKYQSVENIALGFYFLGKKK